MRPCVSRRWLALIAIVFTFTAGCGRGHTIGKRVIVLGFDGMDYRVTRDLMARGRMPNFSRIASAGSFAPLRTTIPAQSPVAWSSFITGRDPGSHGIFDFVHRDPHTMAPYLSTTRSEPARHVLSIGSWQFPLSSARVSLLRHGEPFWTVLERHGVHTTIMRMPANFPPSGSAHRELSGMGTPDILGTYGTFTLFTSSPPRASPSSSEGRIVAVDVVDDIVNGELVGPENPFRTPARNVAVPFTAYLDPRHNVAKIVAGNEERVLKAGEWSDWVPITFHLMPFENLHAMCRFYLKEIRPTFQLYVSPLNLDPSAPAMPISTPSSFAADLARTNGPFYTQGLAEETKALNAHVLSRDEFLQQAAIVHDEITRQYWTALDRFSDELLFYYFGNLDQVSHMLWRARDPSHPAYDPAADAPYREVVENLYVAFDAIVGETMQRLGPETTLIVLSDHGFTSWRRSFHLNDWLRENGYLQAIEPALRNDHGLFQNVDWPRTRAYGLGLNGLYINLKGRERDGIVSAADRDALVEEIRQGLLRTIDPVTGQPVASKVYRREEIYSGADYFDLAPDLIVGYAEGTRVSNESAIGAVVGDVLSNNTSEWSGDHCMDPDVVPGILLTSRGLRQRADSLDRVAAAILAEFGIRGIGE